MTVSQRALSERVSPGGFSMAAVRRRADARLTRTWPFHDAGPRSDFDLNPGISAGEDFSRYKPAAVLIAVTDEGAGDANVLLTRRPETLRKHAGQIAFPGGKMDPDDRDAVSAAVREAEEEVGLPPEAVEPLGFLSTYFTSTGYRVYPVLARIAPGLALRPQEAEVADIFYVPLSFLMNPDNHRVEAREWRGVERRFYAMPYERHYIWGATAGMIRLMYDDMWRS